MLSYVCTVVLLYFSIHFVNVLCLKSFPDNPPIWQQGREGEEGEKGGGRGGGERGEEGERGGRRGRGGGGSAHINVINAPVEINQSCQISS